MNGENLGVRNYQHEPYQCWLDAATSCVIYGLQKACVNTIPVNGSPSRVTFTSHMLKCKRQTAVTVYLKRKQLLLFAFARQRSYIRSSWPRRTIKIGINYQTRRIKTLWCQHVFSGFDKHLLPIFFKIYVYVWFYDIKKTVQFSILHLYEWARK